MWDRCFPVVKSMLFVLSWGLAGSAVAMEQPVFESSWMLSATDSVPAETDNKTPAATHGRNRDSFDAEAFTITESIFAVFSWLAAEEPNGYGALLLAVTPWAVAEAEAEFPGDDDTLGKVAVIGLVAIVAGYNISVDDDDYDKREVFRNNFLFYNLVVGTGYLIGKITDDGKQSFESNRPTTSLGLGQIEHGIELRLNYRF